MSIQNHHIITPCFLPLSASFNPPSPSGGFCCRVSAVACQSVVLEWCSNSKHSNCLPENDFQGPVTVSRHWILKLAPNPPHEGPSEVCVVGLHELARLGTVNASG